jgi:hypothetical protein
VQPVYTNTQSYEGSGVSVLSLADAASGHMSLSAAGAWNATFATLCVTERYTRVKDSVATQGGVGREI